jgi:hypothetical protein
MHELADRLQGHKLNLLCIDADGNIDWTFNHVAHHLAAGAVVIIDDYASQMSEDKSSTTKPVVDRLCELGYLQRWGLLAGQTWIGCANKEVGDLGFNSMFITRVWNRNETQYGPPACFVRLPDEFSPHSDEKLDGHSSLLLLEDGALLGPPHMEYHNVRARLGAYGHWENHLAFSTLDGSDPRTNGRKIRNHFQWSPADNDRGLKVRSRSDCRLRPRRRAAYRPDSIAAPSRFASCNNVTAAVLRLRP